MCKFLQILKENSQSETHEAEAEDATKVEESILEGQESSAIKKVKIDKGDAKLARRNFRDIWLFELVLLKEK